MIATVIEFSRYFTALLIPSLNRLKSNLPTCGNCSKMRLPTVTI
ncbi:MAG: hypothetical protein ACFWTJ_13900 [Lachnoclostridium sp.]